MSKHFDEPNPDISWVKASLARNLTAQNRFDEARNLLKSALEGYTKTNGENHPDTQGVRKELEKLIK